MFVNVKMQKVSNASEDASVCDQADNEGEVPQFKKL